jgi:hypothetical protein
VEVIVVNSNNSNDTIMKELSVLEQMDNELEELRAHMRRTVEMVDNIGEQRRMYATTAIELAKTMTSTEPTELQRDVDDKQKQISELVQQVEALKMALVDKDAQVQDMEHERDFHRRTVMELSRIILPSNYTEDDKIKDGETIKPEKALVLTIRGLKKQIECMEDERQDMITKMRGMEAAMDEMKREKEAREIKISVLEKQFEVMNAGMVDSPANCNRAAVLTLI